MIPEDKKYKKKNKKEANLAKKYFYVELMQKKVVAVWELRLQISTGSCGVAKLRVHVKYII